MRLCVSLSYLLRQGGGEEGTFQGGVSHAWWGSCERTHPRTALCCLPALHGLLGSGGGRGLGSLDIGSQSFKPNVIFSGKVLFQAGGMVPEGMRKREGAEAADMGRDSLAFCLCLSLTGAQ